MPRLPRSLRIAAELGRAGLLRPMAPSRILRAAAVVRRWGPSPAAGYAVSAILSPDEPAVIDEGGSTSFSEIHGRSNALAHALRQRGIGPGDPVGLLCRNHRGFVETTVAIAKLGASGVFMNTRFSGPQLAEVAKREGVRCLVYDAEFGDILGALPSMPRFVCGGDVGSIDPSLEGLVGEGSRADLDPPDRSPRFVILTSGTTGTPKGAQRSSPSSLAPAAALLSRIPLRARERTMIAAPLFHSWGFAHFNLGLLLGSTCVLQRRFDPEATLRAVVEEECSALVVVPVMMQRILQLPAELKQSLRSDRLRVVAVSGSALPGRLAQEWMDAFGENLYNLYGSTEVAWATIATPADLRAAPGTAGQVPFGTRVRIVDEEGRDLPAGTTGRIFVGNEMAFEGYTGGGRKEELAGLLSSGDVGHFDAEGRLFVDGRDDDMIVSGGENVFPLEVEDLLASQEGVEEVAVIGVSDPEWGQRLKAFVVPRSGCQLDAARLQQCVRENLAAYKVPREVVFLERLPRNATGKILKRELR